MAVESLARCNWFLIGHRKEIFLNQWSERQALTYWRCSIRRDSTVVGRSHWIESWPVVPARGESVVVRWTTPSDEIRPYCSTRCDSTRNWCSIHCWSIVNSYCLDRNWSWTKDSSLFPPNEAEDQWRARSVRSDPCWAKWRWRMFFASRSARCSSGQSRWESAVVSTINSELECRRRWSNRQRWTRAMFQCRWVPLLCQMLVSLSLSRSIQEQG